MEGDTYVMPIRNSKGTIIRYDTYRLEKKYPYMAMCVNEVSGGVVFFTIGDFECGTIRKKIE